MMIAKLNPASQPNPPWKTRAKTILLQLETADLDAHARAGVLQQTVQAIGMQLLTLNARLRTLTEAESTPNGSFKDPDAARAQMAAEKANITAEIDALTEEREIVKQRGATASVAATTAAGIYRRAQKAFLATSGATLNTSVGVN